MIIGLTGGSGSGKSLISGFFEKNGFEVIDFDKLTHIIYAPGSDCLKDIAKNFGKDILNPDGSLHRRKLGSIVFADASKLECLNKTVYKYILNYADEIINNSKNKKLLFDAPTLFDAGLNKKCDHVIGVIADKNTRLKRITERDGISQKDALNRIASQKDDEFFIKNCDFIIENNSDTGYAEKCAYDILNKICNISKE